MSPRDDAGAFAAPAPPPYLPSERPVARELSALVEQCASYTQTRNGCEPPVPHRNGTLLQERESLQGTRSEEARELMLRFHEGRQKFVDGVNGILQRHLEFDDAEAVEEMVGAAAREFRTFVPAEMKTYRNLPIDLRSWQSGDNSAELPTKSSPGVAATPNGLLAARQQSLSRRPASRWLSDDYPVPLS